MVHWIDCLTIKIGDNKMTTIEFYDRTGVVVSAEEYREIERMYMHFDGNKDEFCEWWRENCDKAPEERLKEMRAKVEAILRDVPGVRFDKGLDSLIEFWIGERWMLIDYSKKDRAYTIQENLEGYDSKVNGEWFLGIMAYDTWNAENVLARVRELAKDPDAPLRDATFY